MTKYIRRIATPLAFASLIVAGGCTVKEKGSDSTLARDTTLNKDLALANADTAAQPQLRDIPATPAATPAPSTPMTTGTTPTSRPSTSGRTTAPARTTTSRPAPAPARTTPTTTTTASGNTVTRNTGAGTGTTSGRVGVIASGTSLSLRSNARVCTNTYQVGQTFTATTNEAVTGSNGATIPAGSTVTLEVTQLKRSENVNDKIVMEFAVRSVRVGGTTYPVTASVANADVQRVRNEPKSKDVQKVVGGAVIGAIAGQILGKNTKSTVVGAAAGAAAGAGAAAATANYEGCIPDGGAISVTLNSPLQVKIS